MPRIINLTRNTVLAQSADLADTFFSRMKGLLFRKSLARSCALIIKPTSSLHTFFMQFPIDIAFLDKDNKIVKISRDVLPFRLVASPLRAKIALEFPAGTLNSAQTQPGDTISILP